jgi:hypothetical protein
VTRFLLLATFAAACGTTSDAAPPPAKASAAPTDHAICVQVFQQQRTCTDEFIPALVDARAKYDNPPGIAAQVKADRAAVIAQAKVEWATDSTDAAIDQTCQQLSADHAMVASAQQCLAQRACGPFVSCIAPLFEKHLHK